jgi:citrate synthase
MSNNTGKGLENITVASSSISSIVGTTLTYRGYKIEDLAKHASFEEVIYLLWYGVLPTKKELTTFNETLFAHAELPKEVVRLLTSFPHDANTMEVLRTCVSALPIYVPIQKDNLVNAFHIQAKISTLVAALSRVRQGKEPLSPKKEFSYAKNFLYMLHGTTPTELEEEAFNKALILHADHEFNASTFSSRVTVATLSDLYSGIVSAIGTLKGPLHGGANEQVMHMLQEIKKPEHVETYLSHAFENKQKIMGIGHRVYKDGDPRAFILKEMSQRLTEITGNSDFFLISDAVEKIVENEKGLKPNVDFYSASVYHSLGIDTSLFTPIFAVSRTSGWTAHILEQYQHNRLIRPRAEYIGKTSETYVPLEKR